MLITSVLSAALAPSAGFLPQRTPARAVVNALIPSGSVEPLETEELEALAGIWRTNLKLDDGDTSLSLHLDAKTGQVYTADDSALPFNICHGKGSSTANWGVTAVPESPQISLSLQLGILYLEGTGERSGLRCMSLKGSVLEGRDDPCCVGAFDMTLVLPTSQDVAALEERHQARVDARVCLRHSRAPPLSSTHLSLSATPAHPPTPLFHAPEARHPLPDRCSRVPQQPAPPLSFRLDGFVGRWRLLLSLDDEDSASAQIRSCLSARLPSAELGCHLS